MLFRPASAIKEKFIPKTPVPPAPKSCPEGVKMTHLNLNDGTCEGLESPRHKAFAVQYHPENAPGPHDSRYLFQQFLQAIEEGCHA